MTGGTLVHVLRSSDEVTIFEKEINPRRNDCRSLPFDKHLSQDNQSCEPLREVVSKIFRFPQQRTKAFREGLRLGHHFE